MHDPRYQIIGTAPDGEVEVMTMQSEVRAMLCAINLLDYGYTNILVGMIIHDEITILWSK